jgi:catechol 2,3-dioxygenase-like lactoylglutathione lyase family enzyme
MLVVETLHHVSINVTDLARARHFYSVVLGLPELPRPDFDFDGAWYRLGDRQLHLIVHPPARSLRGTTLIDGRDGHYALRISDFDATLAQLQRHDVPLRARRDNPTPWAQIYVTDPDGNVIELNAERVSAVEQSQT